MSCTEDSNNNLTNADLRITSQKNADYNFAYEYDDYDHLHTLTYPDGTVLTYNVAPQGRILAIAPYISNIGYFSDDNLAAFTNNNGTITSYTENGRHMRNSVATTAPGAQERATYLLAKNYVYDGMGNVASITDNIDPSNNQSFTYDPYTNELTGATGPWGSGVLTYDGVGNILTNTAGNNILYTYNASNLLTKTVGSRELSFGYDNAGDIVSIGGLILAYNTLQQVTNMAGASIAANGTRDRVMQFYDYDGNGNRQHFYDAMANTDTFEMYNLKSQLLYKDVPATNTHDLYIMLGGQTIAHIKKVGTTPTNEFYHNDLLGSPKVTTNYQAKSIWSQRYLPYGEQMDDVTNIDKVHTGYTGKSHDNDSDLSYYGARYYFPFIGRFISPDPAAINPDMTATFNRYAYAANNPYKYVDPDGRLFQGLFGTAIGRHATKTVLGVAGAAVVGATAYHISGGDMKVALAAAALTMVTAGIEKVVVYQYRITGPWADPDVATVAK